MRALGERGDVPSPTFALALSYQTPKFVLHHLDLFRGRGELQEDMRELLQDDAAVCVLEWPPEDENLPPPDFALHFSFAGKNARKITMRARGKKGNQWLRAFC